MLNKLNDIFNINERMRALGRQLDFLECQICLVKRANGEKCRAYNSLSVIKEKTKNELNKICADRLKLYDLISNVKDSTIRTLLEYRYVYLMEYDDIAEMTHYSLRQVMRKMNEGIKEIENV